MSQPIRRRFLMSLMVAFGLLVVLAISTTGLIVTSHRGVAAQNATMNGLTDARRHLLLAVSLQETTILDFELSHAQRALDEYNEAAVDESVSGARLAVLAGDDAQLAAIVANVIATASTWRQEWADPLLASLKAGGSPQTVGPLSQAEGERRFSAVESALGDLDQAITFRRGADARSQQVDTDMLVLAILAICSIFGAALVLIGMWLLRTVSAPLARLSQTATSLLAGMPVSFQSERDDEIGTLARVLEQQRLDVDSRYGAAVSEAEQSATYNKLADLISFSATEDELVEAAVRAIRRLTAVPSGDIELANPSQNRLIFAGSWGEAAPEIGRPVPIDRIDRCPGIRRAAAYFIPDVEDDLAVRCPAHPTTRGSAACVPMTALGQVVGVIHLEFPDAHGATAMVAVVARVAEQIAIALANTRLVRTLEGLAMTDSLTGLHNARFFDAFLAQQLAAAERDAEPLGLIMMDIDHFKQFNDTHGHPAGDEALRAFSRVVRAVVRASDVVARYGGEEFIVALPRAGQEEARQVAEKIRLAVEEMVVEIGPGRYARLTVSLGAVATEKGRQDEKALVSLADAALYRAKEGGRNRVATAPTSERELETASRRRRGGSTPDGQIALIVPFVDKPA